MKDGTWVFTHDDCLQHDPGAGHPENPLRLRSVLDALAGLSNQIQIKQAPLASRAQLELAHSADYLDQLFAAAPDGDNTVSLDPDTVMNHASLNAARAGCGAVSAGIDAVMNERTQSVFCAVRPPGHHAERAQAMGFCLLNGVAVGAEYALAEHALERVAIVDFDVHHGNGTQHSFEHNEAILYLSSHQVPLYPGTGQPAETGVGNIVNLPLAPGAGSSELRSTYQELAWPALQNFKPQLLLISAGFDAHRLDPLANLNWVTEDYFWLGEQLRQFADQFCQGRLVATLEGGYSPSALVDAVPAFVRAIAA